MVYDNSGETNREYCELTSAIKSNKHLLNEHLISEEFKNFNEKLQIKNAPLFFQLATIFNLSGLNITVFKYIERCFCMIVESESFLELNFDSVSRIFASSSLQIDTEVEVYNAANKWLSLNSEERSKFSRKLLVKVRLNFLSDHCLNYLINDSSFISSNNDCLEVLKSREIFYQNVSTIHNKSRQCNQNMFNILTCGGCNIRQNRSVSQANELYGNKLKKIKVPSSMIKERYGQKAVCFKGEVYVFGGLGHTLNNVKLVEKYSPVSKTWNYVCDLPDERQYFCACAFVDNIYLFGGRKHEICYLSCCLKFDAKISKWKEVIKMNQSRSNAACAIYGGNIVVSGGKHNIAYFLNTVESYDVFADNWKSMPNMIESRHDHSLFCVKNKLFAIGGDVSFNTYCEVYDKISNMFVTLETPMFSSCYVQTVSIGSKIFVFQNNTRDVLCYDVLKDEWSEDVCEATENICFYSTVRVPL